MKFLLLISSFCFSLFGCQGAVIERTDSGVPNVASEIKEVVPAEAQTGVSKAYSQFVDVRTPDEYASGHAARAVNIPLDTLASKMDTLEKNEPIYLICQTGNRSRKAAAMLKDAGFNNVLNVTGGTVAWQAAGQPIETASPHSPAASSSKLDEKTENALISALGDERKAYATYQAVLSKFPNARPFSNIIEAEQRHESFLLPLFAKYGVTAPKNDFDPARISVPETLTEACKAGVIAEKENIALYDGFLGFVKEPEIKDIFVRLQAASRENHLPAFTRCSEGGGGKGRGPGRLN